MSVVKTAWWLTLFVCVAVVFFTLSLSGCNVGGDDSDAFDAYDITPSSSVEPSSVDSRQKCDETSYDGLPRWVQFSDDGLRLVAGLGTQDEFYRFSTDDDSDIKRIDLQFAQEDWWAQMENNYNSETEISATMSYDGEELESPVGVRFKGFTSYQWNNTEKKSFNISLDHIDTGQDIDGYNTLNLNCAWGDDTFMREVIFEHINRRYIPAVSVNYVELYINGEYWGIYINSQQPDSNFIKEWFTSTNGTRWRAEVMGGARGTNNGPLPGDFPVPGNGAPPGGFPAPPGDGELPSDFPPPPGDGNLPDDFPFPGGGGPPGGFGGGGSALNYLGDSPDDYIAYYDLQRYCWSDPWDDLINVCFALENTSPEEMETEISKYLDLDRALWFLIMENVFADEDSYVNKGAMDFYLYWDDTTGLMVPIEYDGNSTLLTSMELPDILQSTEDNEFPDGTELPGDGLPPGAGPGGGPPGGGPPGGGESFLEWTPFHNADSSRYPLLYKLLNVSSIRQRYLAHMRTVLNESFNEENMDGIIDDYALKIGPYIEDDPKTFITDFEAGVNDLKSAVATRLDTLWSNEELNAVGLVISDVKWIVGTQEYASPSSTDNVQEVVISATVQDLENGSGVESVFAYVGEGIDGNFTRMLMNSAGGDIYTITMAEKASGVRTRFYIEAVAGDAAGTRTYYPSGAAHDVFTFQVDGG